MKLERRHKEIAHCWHGGMCAFSLVEILIVLAVIAILASLSMAAIQRGKGKAKTTTCLSNLHQHGLAVQQFVAEHHEYPLAVNSGFWLGKYEHHRSSWLKALYPDTLQSMLGSGGKDNMGILDCPSTSRPSAVPREIGYLDYGYNQEGIIGPVPGPPLGIGGVVTSTAETIPVRENDVMRPSEMVAMGDGIQGWDKVFADGQAMFGRVFSVTEFYGSIARVRRRHDGKANTLMCDGHVVSLPLHFLFSDQTDSALSVWNRDGQPHRKRLGL